MRIGCVPVIAIAINANPLYLPTPASSAIPVPLEIIIAPIYLGQFFGCLTRFMIRQGEHTSGAHDPLATFFTHSSRITARVNHAAANPIRMTAINGIGVSIVPTKTEPRRARMKSVKRSPRHVATGAVMLSGFKVSARSPLQADCVDRVTKEVAYPDLSPTT